MLLLLNKTTGYNLALAGVKLEWFIISLINKCSKMNKSLMNKAQFFSVIFIVAWLILSFFNGVAPYLWPEIDFSIIYLIRGSLNIFVNILISIWIILEARKYKFYPLLWGALAIFSGLLSVVLFYWILIFKELRRSPFENNKNT